MHDIAHAITGKVNAQYEYCKIPNCECGGLAIIGHKVLCTHCGLSHGKFHDCGWCLASRHTYKPPDSPQPISRQQLYNILFEVKCKSKAETPKEYLMEMVDAILAELNASQGDKDEMKEPYQPPKSNHLEVNYIAVGYYKHEIDFGVLGSVQELSEDDFNKMLHMLNTAIEVAKDMRKRSALNKGEEMKYKPCDKCGQVQCMCEIDKGHLA